MQVTEYQGAIQCGGTKMSSHLLFGGRKDQPVVPRTGSSDFTYCEQDEKRVSDSVMRHLSNDSPVSYVV